MITKINVSTSNRGAVPDIGEQPSCFSQAKRTSRSKLLLAWSIVVLPLAWGLYATGRTAAPLIRALLSHNH
ncbi:MFS transporter small subunit [Granulicella mallensis]